MSRFLQLHLLTFYPPSNLNRDDLGRPKTAVIGGVQRLRISSQALKRAWRRSEVFKTKLDHHLGDRTRRMGRDFAGLLRGEYGLDEERAASIARGLAAVFGKLDRKPKPGQELFIKQLAFISPTERDKLRAFLDHALSDQQLIARIQSIGQAASDEAENDGNDSDAEDEPSGKKSKKNKNSEKQKAKELLKEVRAKILAASDTAADIAMFGRMLADSPEYNREAAAQVAHAFTTHRVLVEDDYYTAVDDLTKRSELDDLERATDDAGAGFVGEAGFGAGVFYLYACIDCSLLVRNLGGEIDEVHRHEATALAGTACAALVESAATVSPSGKQASFASRARAHYLLAERGEAQPRTLAAAFLRPVDANGDDQIATSIERLRKVRDEMDSAYGPCAEDRREMMLGGTTRLEDILNFCRETCTSL